MNFPLPRNEARRLAALRGHEIMDTVPEPAFERVVRLAARFFAMPIAAVTFVEEYRVWCKASHGLPRGEAPREASFCAHAIVQKEVTVIRDARTDPRSVNHLFDVGPGSVRFYAGAPLRTAEGFALGMLCVMDTAPREFTREDEGTLADMAAMAMNELNLRQKTARLRTEISGGEQSRRALARQHRLLQRLSDSQEDRIGLRTAELVQLNASLRAQMVHRERADAAALQAKEEAERANIAKSEFLSRMSHELRTPLNAILGFGQILQGPAASEDQRACAGQVVTAGRHLLSLIEEVLDISRIEAGQMKLSLQQVCASEMIAETIDLIRPLAVGHCLSVGWRGETDPRCEVVADRQRLKQVLLNLLSNAVKYSPVSGRIAVEGRAERGGTLRLSVTDEGPGITLEQSARLFVAFDRLGAEHSGVPGTGLGLALSKRLVEAMGGRIGVESSPGRGSTFWVRLPMREGATLPARTPAFARHQPPPAV